ncbi:MAG: IS66 family insertion sequence element accessory protein TnpB [Lachnospiraceae bacterium]|nr:IS66 family insertion sequence element accessory protein TnpB [Lachnoclostridium sp.]MDY2599909.1 IS66 family insertion sequence element accessory protein TnpB [Lachnospiraceae bacterium]MDY5957220.1 IS66 family insertion sequence element accessory protein TnpB [Frisingicoccus sp.]
MSKRVCKDDQIQLIMECRQSGLSDYQWCKQNGIHPGNFYNWVSKLRKQGYSFPDSQSKLTAVPNIQEVVKVGLIQPQDSSPKVEQNVSLIEQADSLAVAAELLVGGVTLRLFNGADEKLIQNTLRCLGGMNHAW